MPPKASFNSKTPQLSQHRLVDTSTSQFLVTTWAFSDHLSFASRGRSENWETVVSPNRRHWESNGERHRMPARRQPQAGVAGTRKSTSAGSLRALRSGRGQLPASRRVEHAPGSRRGKPGAALAERKPGGGVRVWRRGFSPVSPDGGKGRRLPPNPLHWEQRRSAAATRLCSTPHELCKRRAALS